MKSSYLEEKQSLVFQYFTVLMVVLAFTEIFQNPAVWIKVLC